jgi:dihydroorotate dehydrogenase (fumarate)
MDWSTFSIGNAAGFIKGPGLPFDDILASAATDITIGSITLEPRAGNPGVVYWDGEDGTSINSLGLPNPGMAMTVRYLPALFRQATQSSKRLRISIAGFSPEEYQQLSRQLHDCGSHYHEIEINLGCPNVWGEGGQKPIASFDLDLIRNVLMQVMMGFRVEKPCEFSLKLSPLSDPLYLASVAELVRKSDTLIDRIVTSNTFPNGLAFEGQKRAIDIPYGGVGGTALRHIALGQVAQFSEALKGTNVKIIGVGGISCGNDVSALLAAGASGVQIGTAYGKRQGKIFSDIGLELMEGTG